MAARLGPLAPLLLAVCFEAGWYSTSVQAQSFLPEARTTQGGENARLSAGPEWPADLFSIDGMGSRLQPRPPDYPSDLFFAPRGRSLPDNDGTNPAAVPGDLVPPEGSRPEPGFQVPLTGPVFLFGQVNRDEVAAAPASSLSGQTGVAWKQPIPGAAELLLRCGPELSSLEPPRSGRVPEHFPFPIQPHGLRLDAHCRWSLGKGLGLEYQGTARPAFDPGEPDGISQDLRVVVPAGSWGQWHVGAKYSWEISDEPRQRTESSEIYGGLRFRW
jgi:hypothetical protein